MTTPANKPHDPDPTLTLLRRFRPLLLVAFVALGVAPRIPDFQSGDLQTQVGAVLGIGFYACLTWSLWNMSADDAHYLWVTACLFGFWAVVFVFFYGWLWTTNGFSPEHVFPLVMIAVVLPASSVAAYRRVRGRPTTTSQRAGKAGGEG